MSDQAAFFDAIRRGDTAAVDALLTADPELAGARTPEGATPVLWAVYTRHADLAHTLLGGRDPDFFEACALGKDERAAALLAQDPGLVHACSCDGFSALGLAVYFGHESLARRLVAAGADVNLPSRNHIRVAPLHSAVESGNLALLVLLLDHGADPNCVEFLEATPLHSASARGDRAMAERILAAGADPHRKTKDGKTAADLAREFGEKEAY